MKTAVFYDLENLGLASKNGEFERELLALLQKIKASDLVGEITLQKAYIAKSHPSLPKIEPVLQKHKIELVAVQPMSKVPQKKANMVDFKMGIDVIATIAGRRSIQTVAVASGDSDFGFLCQQIKELGRQLLVVSRYSITGDTLLALCDDWIDLTAQAIQPKFINKVIESRIPKTPGEAEFIKSFGSFLGALEEDLLVRRYMTEYGLPVSLFVDILNRRGIRLPKYYKLGFTSFTAFFTTLLYGTGFGCTESAVKYSGKQESLSQMQLITNLMNMPAQYSREKLLRYYDLLREVESADELVEYIRFMKRSGMLKNNTLCQKRTFRATIRTSLQALLKNAGINIDEAVVKKFSQKL